MFNEHRQWGMGIYDNGRRQSKEERDLDGNLGEGLVLCRWATVPVVRFRIREEMKELTEQGNTQHPTTSAGNTGAKNSSRKEL